MKGSGGKRLRGFGWLAGRGGGEDKEGLLTWRTERFFA